MPKLYRTGKGLICGAHYLATGPSIYHVSGCYKCDAIKAARIAEGKPLKPDASNFTLRQRQRGKNRNALVGHATPEQIAEARARGWASMGFVR